MTRIASRLTATRFFVGWLVTLFVSVSALAAPDDWFDEAVIYGIAPRYITETRGQGLKTIETHLPEIKELGANTLWLQPIYENSDDEQGYHVTDYFKVRPDVGTGEDLRSLIRKAHASGLRVIFDFVPNHLSVHHPFAKDVAAKGHASPYYGFFMHQKDRAPYSDFYQSFGTGSARFVTYFWKDMVNLDFRNEKAREHVLQAAEYWVREFDIDGYRLDAAWAPMARSPDFMVELRDRLKALKPGFFLLAEDKAGRPEAYGPTPHVSSAEVFDAVYDWTTSAEFISEWSWARGDDETLFDWDEDGDVAGEIARSVFAYGREGKFKARVLRFIENNDHPRFIVNHSLERTRVAAALTFLLPGIPLLYYGQEVGWGAGDEIHDEFPIFEPGEPIRSWDRSELWPYYQRLISLRKSSPALTRGTIEPIPVQPAKAAKRVFAFRRKSAEQVMDVAVNLDWRRTTFRFAGQKSHVTLEPYSILVVRNGTRIDLR